jgi:hypothetical protein
MDYLTYLRRSINALRAIYQKKRAHAPKDALVVSKMTAHIMLSGKVFKYYLYMYEALFTKK